MLETLGIILGSILIFAMLCFVVYWVFCLVMSFIIVVLSTFGLGCNVKKEKE
jgi:hypothetical protein